MKNSKENAIVPLKKMKHRQLKKANILTQLILAEIFKKMMPFCLKPDKLRQSVCSVYIIKIHESMRA